MGRNNTGQNNNSEWSPTEPDQDHEQVTLIDELGRTLDCLIRFSLKFSDQEYALLEPVDYPVEIFVVLADSDEEETLMPLEDEDVEPIFDVAKAILAEQNLLLKRTAHFLTVEGEVPLADEVEIVTFEDDEASEQEEEYQPLGSKFFHQDREYAIYMPLSPMLLVARLRSGQKPEVLSPQDFQHIQPLIEEHLEKHLVDWMGEDGEDW